MKFTDSGRVRLAASLCDAAESRRVRADLRFEVADTGIGIAKDEIALAFARFSQLDPSKSRKAGGTGLGLAIVAKSVELMGGEISVESEKGRGTRFVLSLPFEPGPDESRGSGNQAPLGPGNVALAGFDDEAFADAALALSRLGFAALKVDSIEAAASPSFDFALADEMLLAEIDDDFVGSIASRLIVATRLGGEIRSRLGGRGIAFVSLPLQSSRLRHAFSALAASGAQGCAAAEPKSSVDLTPEGRAILERLALALERAAEGHAYADVQHDDRSLLHNGFAWSAGGSEFFLAHSREGRNLRLRVRSLARRAGREKGLRGSARRAWRPRRSGVRRGRLLFDRNSWRGKASPLRA